MSLSFYVTDFAITVGNPDELIKYRFEDSVEQSIFEKSIVGQTSRRDAPYVNEMLQDVSQDTCQYFLLDKTT